MEQKKKEYGDIVVVGWRGDSVFYKKETGEFTINTQESVAAASSWFTAALVMTFVDQGKISLDDPVSQYLPIYSKYAKSYLTLRHCLTHTTGLEAEKGGIQKMFAKTKFASLEEAVDAFASRREIITNPGEEVYYSNIGIEIVGRVLEVVGKKSFDRLMLERIFRPIGMKRSTFASETAINPYNGAITTPSDFAKFLGMLLRKGTFNNKQVLKPESVEELFAIQNKDIKIAFIPTIAQGYPITYGAFAQETDEKGNASIIASPGITGSWAYIDRCRQYACVVLVKKQNKEDKKDFYLAVKEELEAGMSGSCAQ